MVKIMDVRKMFAQAPDRGAKIRTNPVTGGDWVPGLDSTEAQIKVAWRALTAREACAVSGLLRGHSLPLNYGEREAAKQSAFGYGVSMFAHSLRNNDYVLPNHPPFDFYMAGLLAKPEIGRRLLKGDPSLAVFF